MYAREWLETIAKVVKETGGFYGFSVDGEDYAIVRRGDLVEGGNEVQLTLEGAGRDKEREIEREIMRANEVLESYRLQREQGHEEEEAYDFDELATDLPIEREGGEGTVLRVKFEPLRGDLPPDLQE